MTSRVCTSEDIAAYRELLLEIGVALEVPNADDLCRKITARLTDEGHKNLVAYGFFSSDKKHLLILPPELVVLTAVRDAVAEEDAYEPLASRLEAMARMKGLVLAPVCNRSPCSLDAKVTVDELAKARALVGTPKKKTTRPFPSAHLYVAYGMGVDSTAILVGLAQLARAGRPEFIPDWIVFADTGAEHEATHRYLDVINKWLKKVGFPQVQIVCYATGFASKSFGSSRTLEQQTLLNQQMPAISATKFQTAQCSKLWKQDAQKKWLEQESGLFDNVGRSYVVKPGIKIVKAIGYDADETGREKRGTFRVEDDKRLYAERGIENPFSYWLPLMDFGWNRARCIAEIEAEIGAVPPKSACVFCGAAKRAEIEALPKDELLRALMVEQVALNGWHAADYKANNNLGLGVKFSWTEFALEKKLITDRDYRALMEKVYEVAALPQDRGVTNLADHPVIRSLPAFKKLHGFRGRKLSMLWDRNDQLVAKAEEDGS